MKIWRARPTNPDEAKKQYQMTETYFLEEKLDEINITKMKQMPFISKRSVDEIKRDDQMGEDEFKIQSLIEDLPLLEAKEAFWEEQKQLDLGYFE